MSKWLSRLLLVAALVAVAVAVRESVALPRVVTWLEGLGAWGALAFAALHGVGTLCLVPSVVPTFAAGVLYGLAPGLGLSLVGASLGAVGALLIGRYVARASLERRFARDTRFARLNAAVARKGWRIVALARLTPVFPFSIGNYLFGLSRIPAHHYGAASLLGTIPSNAVYVYLGSVSGSLAALEARSAERTPAEWALLGIGLAATIALAWALRRLAAGALDQDLAEDPSGETSTR